MVHNDVGCSPLASRVAAQHNLESWDCKSRPVCASGELGVSSHLRVCRPPWNVDQTATRDRIGTDECFGRWKSKPSNYHIGTTRRGTLEDTFYRFCHGIFSPAITRIGMFGKMIVCWRPSPTTFQVEPSVLGEACLVQNCGYEDQLRTNMGVVAPSLREPSPSPELLSSCLRTSPLHASVDTIVCRGLLQTLTVFPLHLPPRSAPVFRPPL